MAIITDDEKRNATDVPTTPAQQKACVHCKFHSLRPAGDQTLRSICRINPPTVASVFVQQPNGFQIIQGNVWPEMAREDWCGKFEQQVQ